jgi:hypothetical protein
MPTSTLTSTPLVRLSAESRRIAGILLLSITAIEFGGYYLTRVVRGEVPLTDFQESFNRAGHAHAGVLVTLALITVVLSDAVRLRGIVGWAARHGVPFAAIFMSAGFFLSSAGAGTTQPNGWIFLLWLGAVLLAAGVLSLGFGLLRSSFGPQQDR